MKGRGKRKWNCCTTCYTYFGKHGGKHETCKKCWQEFLNKKHGRKRKYYNQS